MPKLLKLLVTIFILIGLLGCGQLHIRSQKWIDRPTQKIDQLSIAWVSNASGDWSGTSSNQNFTANSFSGAGIPAIANELDFGKIGGYFKTEGSALLRSQGFVGQVEATDSTKEMVKIIQATNSQKYWLVFEAVRIRSIATQTGPMVFIAVTASLKDMQAGKEIWTGTYDLQAKKNLIDGRQFDSPMVKDMVAAALKSIAM